MIGGTALAGRRFVAALVMVAAVSAGCTGDGSPGGAATTPTSSSGNAMAEQSGSPDEARVWLLRGCALLGLGRVDEALEAFEKSTAIVDDTGVDVLVAQVVGMVDPATLAAEPPCPT